MADPELSEKTTPNAGVNVDISPYVHAAAGMNEVEQNRYFQREAVAFVRKDPGRAARLYGQKFLNYFNYRNELATTAEASKWKDLTVLFTYGALLTLVVMRLFRARRMPLRRQEVFTLTLYVLNGIFAAVFFTRIRFRLPFDILLILVVAGFLGRLIERRGLSETRRTN